MKIVLDFLNELQSNNNKEWFNDNRKLYDKARQNFLAFTEMLINEIRTFDTSVPLLNPKDCMFRIFRDVRFSNDKTPYKTNFGSHIAPEGRKSIFAGYYFHIEPGNFFVGGGCYMPQANELKAIRDAIVETPEEYLEIINSDSFKSTFGEVWGDEVKTYPRGYDKDWKHIDLIKKKSYVGMKKLEDKTLLGNNLLNETMNIYKALYPYNRFLNDALKK